MTSKLLFSAVGRADRTLLTSGVNRQMRNFFAYLRIAFNKVDAQRLQEVGPDRLCAEWFVLWLLDIYSILLHGYRNSRTHETTTFLSAPRTG